MTVTIKTTSLPNGTINVPYSAKIDVEGAPQGAKFGYAGTRLPAGLELRADFTISGTPIEDGTFQLNFVINDANDQLLAAQPLTLTIEKPDEANGDQEKTQKPRLNKRAIITLVIIGLLVVACVIISLVLTSHKGSSTATATSTAVATQTTVMGTATPLATAQSTVVDLTSTPIIAAVTEMPTAEPTATAVATDVPVVSTDAKALAEIAWGESLPDQPAAYVAGGDGYPAICNGLCWDISRIDHGVMLWYGPWNGEEDITEADGNLGNGDPGPLDLMREGKITKVIFYLGKEAQLETCALGTLDGQPLSDILGIKAGECGDRVAIQPGWHIIEGNANSSIAGFGIRFTASGWAGMSEAQIVEYTGYWKISGDTATWVGPKDIEIMMTPAMVQMMQDFDILHNIVFTTTKPGKVLFCNGNVTGDATLSSKDGSCQYFDVPAGTFSYHGEARLSAGISWQPGQ